MSTNVPNTSVRKRLAGSERQKDESLASNDNIRYMPSMEPRAKQCQMRLVEKRISKL